MLNFSKSHFSEIAFKNIATDLIKGEKLDGINYNMWYRKIQYLLNEQEVIETLIIVMEPPKKGNTVQHRHDKQTYDDWLKKDHCEHFTMLRSMHNYLRQFENCRITLEMWNQLSVALGKLLQQGFMP